MDLQAEDQPATEKIIKYGLQADDQPATEKKP